MITRFAPSPTGFMHIGGVRTALYAFLAARKSNGTFILRIEDTDKAREVPGSIEHIMESLRWLELDWDYGPDRDGPFGSVIQSKRLSVYQKYAKNLVEKGYAYPDPFTEEEVAAWRKKAELEKRPFLFRDHRPPTFASWDGNSTLRFRVPEIKRYQWQDAVRGSLEAGEEALDDFVLMKSDGYPTYNFAHIVDDHEMGVTHIFRADEFISSTPRFLSLYEALGVTPPAFVTLPPILRDDKTKKLGKRDGAKDILEYRSEGYVPGAIRNYLALIGWNPGTDQELFSKEELISAFSIDRIQSHGAVFNEEKLLWFNNEYLKRLTLDEYQERLLQYIPEPIKKLPGWSLERLQKALPTIREHIRTLGEIGSHSDELLSFYFLEPTLQVDKMGWKGQEPEVTKRHLVHVMTVLEEISIWSPDSLKAALWEYATTEGRGEVLWPMRYGLTGLEKSPDPFTVATILGKEETLTRLRKALATIG